MRKCLRQVRMWIILKSWKSGKNTAFIPWKSGKNYVFLSWKSGKIKMLHYVEEKNRHISD